MIKNIVIIGMPGSGKSTLGKIIGEKLNRPFIDMDDYIELNEKKSIKEMFAISEDCFRDAESKYSILLGQSNSKVISTGGGVVKREENIKNLKKNSVIVFINRSVENIINDIDVKTRPLLKDGAEVLHKLYNERINLYKKYCDIEINNDGELESLADLIIEKVEVWNHENKCN